MARQGLQLWPLLTWTWAGTTMSWALGCPRSGAGGETGQGGFGGALWQGHVSTTLGPEGGGPPEGEGFVVCVGCSFPDLPAAAVVRACLALG